MRTVFEAVRLIDGVSAEARDGMRRRRRRGPDQRPSSRTGHASAAGADPGDGTDRHRRPRPHAPPRADRRARPLHVRSDRGLDRRRSPVAPTPRSSSPRPDMPRGRCGPASRPPAAPVPSATSSSCCATRSPPVTSRGHGSWRAASPIGITGGHGHQFGIEADGEHELRRAVRRQVRDGADVVKVVASEAAMLTTTGLAPGRMVHGDAELTESEIAAIVAEARRFGVRVMSHAQGPESVIASARGGVDSVEHAWLADRAAIETLAASGAFLVPTLVVTDVNRDAPRPDAGPARTSGPDRAATPRLLRDGDRARRAHRDRHRHRRGRGHIRHGLARDRAAPRPRRVADGRDPGRDERGGAAARPRRTRSATVAPGHARRSRARRGRPARRSYAASPTPHLVMQAVASSPDAVRQRRR